MQLLWIGCLESDEAFISKAKKGYELASAQLSQKNLVKGMEAEIGLPFDSINGSVLPPYPVYQDRVIEPIEWSHSEGAYDISVGYLNDRYVNRLYCRKAMLAAARKWIQKRYQGEDLTVFVYSMRSAPMATACYIKREIPQARLFLIVTDLPRFMDLGQTRVKAALKRIDGLSIQQMQKRFDGFVLYASPMAEYLKLPDGKWLLMEGSYDAAECRKLPNPMKKKAVMYSGKLELRYGIPLLLEAFMSMALKDAELWITGGGNGEAYIRECARKDSRIKFYGFLPNRADVLRLQQEASLLVNLRLPSEPSSKYCFPSKLLEYMATGVPVLSFRLGGIPEEYLPYLCIVEEETRESIREAIENCLNAEDAALSEKGAAARRFVCERKNLSAQCRRICAFVREIEKHGDDDVSQ